jgi:hypothetical protein
MNVFKLQRKFPQFRQEDILALSNNFAYDPFAWAFAEEY